jgi:hypothetical protein
MDSSGTDSEEDEEGSDLHKQAKTRHAIDHLKQPVTIMLKGRYEWNNGWEEVIYQRNMLDRIAPEDIIEPLSIIYEKVSEVAIMAGVAALPLPVQGLVVTKDQLDVEGLRIWNGVRIINTRLDQKGFPAREYRRSSLKPSFQKDYG